MVRYELLGYCKSESEIGNPCLRAVHFGRQVNSEIVPKIGVVEIMRIKYTVQSTKYRVQSTKNRVQRTRNQ